MRLQKGQNPNHPPRGSRTKVEPIRTKKAIEVIKSSLRHNPRDLCLFTLGINTAFRANELLSIRVGQVRHLQHRLASGQAIATALGYTPLTAADLAELHPLSFRDSTPLWYYILKEALVQQGGQRLGEVGSRIVAEVFFGLLLVTPGSYLLESGWTPDLPRRDGTTTGPFTMTDLLTFAGVA